MGRRRPLSEREIRERNRPLSKREMRERNRLKRKRRRRKRIMLLIVELMILAVLCAAAYVLFKFGKLDFNFLDTGKLDVYKDTGPYTNIALFGLDSREGEIDGGVQSDCIMIASINNDTNDVKLVSVYRDTLLQQADGTYEKANSAYNRGGPEEAISLLNRNFDLDIKNYMSVNFNALVDVIDLLGGLDIELTAEEAFYSNGYAFETAQVTGKEMIPIEETEGMHHLDGVHAVGYARIRYTEGDDFKRAERQRFVLKLVAEKAKSADFHTLNKIVDQVFPQVSTSFSVANLLGFAANALKYNFVDTAGFPFEVTTSEDIMNHTGSYVIPIDLSSNITRLHEYFFDDQGYEPSDTVYAIDDDLVYLSGVTEDWQSVEMNFVNRTSGEEEGADK